MTDIIDRAAEQEEIHRAAALANALTTSTEPQDIDAAGNHYCNDCGIKIPAKRVAALPKVVCCIGCQNLRETKRKKLYGSR